MTTQIGRGFVLWEPHLEVSKVLLGLLEMCCAADWWVPSHKYGLPLTPSGDSCRTSRLALKQVALVRPQGRNNQSCHWCDSLKAKRLHPSAFSNH